MLFPTTLVGSYPQPDWLIDRKRLAGRFPPRVRALELWRVPEPYLAEAQDDATIMANMNDHAAAKQALGISGRPNRNGNDGTITRFGWKAQNKSLEIFAGEAYNVEMGVTNELFQTERPNPGEGLPASCLFNPTPEDSTHFQAAQHADVPSDVTQFAIFMRLLAPPAPSTTRPGGAASIVNGRVQFDRVGCSFCHTPSLKTAPSSARAPPGARGPGE